MMPSTEAALTLDAFGLSDIGFVRKTNEDVIVIRDDLALYAVFDGAGGHDAGDIAAQAAARSVQKHLAESQAEAMSQPEFDSFGIALDGRRLATAMHQANKSVTDIANAAKSRRGMGTTVVALLFSKRSSLVHVVHAGDSRCYRLRAGNLEQLTVDHSMINDVIEQRPDLEDSVLSSLPQHAVTRALGMEDRLRVPLASHQVVDGDRFLLVQRRPLGRGHSRCHRQRPGPPAPARRDGGRADRPGEGRRSAGQRLGGGDRLPRPAPRRRSGLRSVEHRLDPGRFDPRHPSSCCSASKRYRSTRSSAPTWTNSAACSSAS